MKMKSVVQVNVRPGELSAVPQSLRVSSVPALDELPPAHLNQTWPLVQSWDSFIEHDMSVDFSYHSVLSVKACLIVHVCVESIRK